MNKQVRATVTQEEEGKERETSGDEEMFEPEPDHGREEDQEEEDSPFQLSVHAVQGTSSGNQTFTLMVQLGKAKGTALVDSGSSATFINTNIALKAGWHIHNNSAVKVIVANGETL